MSSKILLLEDEIDSAAALEILFQREGYEVFHASSVGAAQSLCQIHSIELAILDINLESKSRTTTRGQSLLLTQEDQGGFQFAAWFRDRCPSARIIFLTSRQSIDERVKGLDLGGDDFLQKPIHSDELLARVRANLRRLEGSSEREEVIGRWRYRLGSNELRHLDNKELKGLYLTFAEVKIFSALVEAQGGILSRETLSKRAFGRPLTVRDRAVDTSISKLRTKIDTGSTNEKSLIESVYGKGYRINRS